MTIRCVVDLIREGRCALVTSFQCFKCAARSRLLYVFRRRHDAMIPQRGVVILFVGWFWQVHDPVFDDPVLHSHPAVSGIPAEHPTNTKLLKALPVIRKPDPLPFSTMIHATVVLLFIFIFHNDSCHRRMLPKKFRCCRCCRCCRRSHRRGRGRCPTPMTTPRRRLSLLSAPYSHAQARGSALPRECAS